MYLVKTLTLFSNKASAEASLEECPADLSEVIRVPLPKGKTFDDVAWWRLPEDGMLEYKLRDEAEWRYFKQ
ncbi:MAG: hypothetical protein EOM21_20265 [Gammaproteobacteria bacterium]|nr:hypothetical protein [Gammaproteobacteria bacterium]